MSRDDQSIIRINGQEYSLYHAPNRSAELPGRFVSAQPVGALPGAEAIRLFEDYSGGMGFGRRLVGNGYSYARNACTRFPDMVFPGPKVTTSFTSESLGGNLVAGLELDGKLFFVGGRYALRIPLGSAEPGIDQDFGAGFVAKSITPTTGGPPLVGGTGGNIWRFTTSWSQSADTAREHLTYVYWVTGGQNAAAGQGGLGSWRVVGTNASGLAAFQYITDAGPDPFIDANWGPADPGVYVGQGNFPIQRLVSTNRTVWFILTSGIHSVDGNGYSANLTPYWRDQWDGTWNGAAACYWNGYIYAAHAHYLDRVLADGRLQQVPQRCGPGDPPFPNEGPIWGHVSALAVVDGWLCASVYNPNADESSICFGRERLDGEDGYGPLVWHGAEIVIDGQVTMLKPSALFITASSGNQPHLWIGSVKSGVRKLSWVPLARGGSPLQDPLYRFATSWSLYTGKDDGGQQNSWTLKAPRSVDLYADNLNVTGSRIKVYSSTDSGAWVKHGTAATTPRNSFGMSQSIGSMHELKLECENPEASPLILRSTALHTIMLPRQIKQQDFRILCGGPDGERRSPEELKRELEALMTSGDVEVGWMGDRYTAKILPGIATVEVPDPANQGKLDALAVSIDFIRKKWRWNDGTKWDQGAVWGGT